MTSPPAMPMTADDAAVGHHRNVGKGVVANVEVQEANKDAGKDFDRRRGRFVGADMDVGTGKFERRRRDLRRTQDAAAIRREDRLRLHRLDCCRHSSLLSLELTL